MKVQRHTVDLFAYPDLVVIYLGMKVNTLAGIRTILGFGPRITNAVDQKPEGLLLHEPIIYSIFPMHAGMRQYWRDFNSLERWSRSEPHMLWWKKFLRDSGGTGFWHETYFMRGGMEAIYDDMPKRIGFGAFAPLEVTRGSMFSARTRLKVQGGDTVPLPITEKDFIPTQHRRTIPPASSCLVNLFSTVSLIAFVQLRPTMFQTFCNFDVLNIFWPQCKKRSHRRISFA